MTAPQGGDSPESDQDNPLRDLADILDARAAQSRPARETDRASNYRRPPTPPGLNLAVTSLDDEIRRDPELIDHVHETARVTTPGHATDRLPIIVDAATTTEILDYLDANRERLPDELRARLNATSDRLRRTAWGQLTRTRLVCPHCGNHSVVPTPKLDLLVCLDYGCAPYRPRVIDVASAQEPDRHVNASQLARILGYDDEDSLKRRLRRHGIKPVRIGTHGRHEYLWADVAHLMPVAPRSGRIGNVLAAAA